MSRPQRLAAAGAVLVLGLFAAWPFRLEHPPGETDAPAPLAPLSQQSTPLQSPPHAPASAGALPATAIATTAPAESLPPLGLDLGAASSGVLFGDSQSAGQRAPVDPPVTPTDAAALATSGLDDSSIDSLADGPLATRTYVIHNGDSLERIAARYLGDEARALEIFDLNRDVLSNPYLLPLGAELTLPAR